MRAITVVALVSLALPACRTRSAAAPPGPPVELTDGQVALTLVPDLGARIVSFSRVGAANVLHSNPAHWTSPIPAPELATEMQPWNGHTFWLGPQTAWWTQQDLRPDRRAVKAKWPPDPFHETARYAIVERSPKRVVLKTGSSPVTGVERTLDVELPGEARARIRVTVTNRRDTAVSWDIWSNTRVRPEGWTYVPLDMTAPQRVEAFLDEDKAAGAYPHEMIGAFVLFPPGHHPAPPKTNLRAKGFHVPSPGVIACFVGRELFLKKAPIVPIGELHPEQSFVEVYRGAAPQPGDDILELEMHGAYETLAPGQSMSFEETWELRAYEGPSEPAAHVAHLTALLAER